MKNGKPARAIDWSNPSTQWTPFAGGYQEGGSSSRTGQPTGITAAANGDLFLADDRTGAVYHITRKRPR
jgi:hypothetical protein